MKHVMLDIEALGNGNEALLVSLGAVCFDPNGSGLGEEFYRVIDPEDAQRAGGKIDVSTALWWMNQSPEARAVFSDPAKMKLRRALHEFSKWLTEVAKPDFVWANGTPFDMVILRSAYRMVGLQVPWSFRSEMDFRTICKQFGYVQVRPATIIGDEVAHNALDDARRQARALQAIYAGIPIAAKN